jgi:hypothetical protein
MLGKDTPDNIFINVSTKGSVDRLRDAWTTEAGGVATFQLNDGLDTFK